MNDPECEDIVVKEHDALVGKLIAAKTLTGYLGVSDEQVELFFKEPIIVRVCPMKAEDGVIHYTDDWIDPYWDVEIVDEKHSELPAAGLRSCWVFGHSINTKTGERTMSKDWQVLLTERYSE